MDKEKFVELLEDFCFDYDYDLVDDYSGRGMYGSVCYGIRCPGKDTLIDLVCFLYDNDASEFVDMVRNARWDSLGLDTIMYFPTITGISEEED